jgi:hypothetical protein
MSKPVIEFIGVGGASGVTPPAAGLAGSHPRSR